MRTTLTRVMFGAAATCLFMCAPIALAQSAPQDEMHATIWAALLSDPRTANIPPAQMQALVNALADQAQVQGISAQEIKWRPAVGETFGSNELPVEESCSAAFSALCPFSAAFGFVGTDPTTPAVLFVTAGLLLLLIRRIIKHHRAMLDKQKMVAAKPLI